MMLRTGKVCIFMQTETIDLNDAQAHFKEVMRRVVSGLHVILSENQKPVAHLTPVGTRVAGLHIGAIAASDDFDDALPDDFWSESK